MHVEQVEPHTDKRLRAVAIFGRKLSKGGKGSRGAGNEDLL